MKKMLEKFSEVIIFGMIVLTISAVVDVGFISLADEAEETTVTEGGGDNFDCRTAVMEYLNPVDEEFGEFLDSTLTSTGTTSDLITNYLIPKYVEYLEGEKAALESATNVSGSYDLLDVSDKISECKAIMDEHLDANTEIMKSEVASSVSAKKTTALVDEYKWINEHLREMSMSVAYIQSYLSKMSTSFTRFTKTCIQQ
ncbi:MAG: hypothetical protein ACD_51C00298G0002 [uncultured bacterium]|nr:MAG: hypothetical protein ACD_51C00298G0002 [uncultured bacterium]OGJ46964.1 MAG: hypothetical protein A2244_04455 [Candidatus Peregrinibacteria bacterium RIFOXYA2_FULL_41_18]OGJ49382.1 MAG: hypothetical protein A2344_03070 [Candidatus Peregrinibacteria bacterium RIFOXYB12_FULL_41_12]OGJ53594.1 MAG: hypothetical protein A2448_02920 [Candidatus Peregrinibacteria bacterium RIFOXYC2_FULL_41_22]